MDCTEREAGLARLTAFRLRAALVCRGKTIRHLLLVVLPLVGIGVPTVEPLAPLTDR